MVPSEKVLDRLARAVQNRLDDQFGHLELSQLQDAAGHVDRLVCDVLTTLFVDRPEFFVPGAKSCIGWNCFEVDGHRVYVDVHRRPLSDHLDIAIHRRELHRMFVRRWCVEGRGYWIREAKLSGSREIPVNEAMFRTATSIAERAVERWMGLALERVFSRPDPALANSLYESLWRGSHGLEAENPELHLGIIHQGVGHWALDKRLWNVVARSTKRIARVHSGTMFGAMAEFFGARVPFDQLNCRSLLTQPGPANGLFDVAQAPYADGTPDLAALETAIYGDKTAIQVVTQIGDSSLIALFRPEKTGLVSEILRRAGTYLAKDFRRLVRSDDPAMRHLEPSPLGRPAGLAPIATSTAELLHTFSTVMRTWRGTVTQEQVARRTDGVSKRTVRRAANNQKIQPAMLRACARALIACLTERAKVPRVKQDGQRDIELLRRALTATTVWK